jgi:hypothetical protein
VTSSSSSPHRRITVIVDWTPSTSGNSHTMRFSSLVYPLDYTSYPAGSGTSEATGATIRVAGPSGAETFGNVYLTLPSARSAASSSTLRSAQGSAASLTGSAGAGAGALSWISCVGVTDDIADCVSTADSNADNDAGTTAANSAQTPAATFGARSVHTPGGVRVTSPAGTASTRASTDACNSCGFGDADGEPWAEGSSSATTGSTATFSTLSDTLTGALWNIGPGWSTAASADHDATGGGVVTSTASLHSPAMDVLQLDGVSGFAGAVKVGAFDAVVRTMSGHTATAPSASLVMPTIEVWNGTGYQAVTVTPGTPAEIVATPFAIGDHQVQLTSRIVAQPSTATSAGSPVKSDAAAQLPSLLVVSVEVTVTSVATAAPTAAFSVTFDYGRISAHSTWVQQ